MATPESSRPPRGLRISDLVGLVVGYGIASLLARTLWPRSHPLTGAAAAFFGLVFAWLGLAMSGPIVLLLGRRGGIGRSHRPARPGRPISEVAPLGRDAVAAPIQADPPRYTRAELAWLVIGGYWIALAMFVVPARSVDTPWALAGLLPLVAAIGLWVGLPRRADPGELAKTWTHLAASSLLWTWPIAWALMILLSRSL